MSVERTLEFEAIERAFERMESCKDRPTLRPIASLWKTGGASSIKA